ncbi:MAG: type II toxin-antitoxin system VapC family toxin [Blastocatellales bacterium]
MYILDTDHVSLLEKKQTAESQRLLFRLTGVPSEEKATTIVTFEEQMRGWMAWIAQAPSLREQVVRYGYLNQTLQRYCAFTVLDFDEHAAEGFQRLKTARIRIGAMDLKIASIALANNATLLSRNLKDFSKVPGLKVEDWAA